MVGDAEQQAIIKAGGDDGAGGEKTLGAAHVGIRPGVWHSLKLTFDGDKITGIIDGKIVLTATDALYKTGMAGLPADRADSGFSRPFFDNFTVAPIGSKARLAQPPLVAKPMYR